MALGAGGAVAAAGAAASAAASAARACGPQKTNPFVRCFTRQRAHMGRSHVAGFPSRVTTASQT